MKLKDLVASLLGNQVAGAPVFSFKGWFGIIYSERVGDYQNPHIIDGYVYNPEDGGWYSSPPAPDYGIYIWSGKAGDEKSEELSIRRQIIIEHNSREGLTHPPMTWTDEIVSVWHDVNSFFSSANKFVQRVDPLALDLDNDGLETISANSGITFDFDGDGLKSGTGWLAKDDAFLAWDRDGNGKIDSGAELFGIDYVKTNGEKATNGFDALKDLDSNGDGVFDANDTQFASVQVWQDLNQDGVSQADELKSLADHHITSINLTATDSNQNSNGNIISAIGSFMRDDGSTGEVNGNQSIAGNLDLASNPFYREFTDHLPLDEAAKALPDMKGSGAVRDLREASMQNTALKGVLAEYAGAQTREQQIALLDSLLSEWADSSNYRTFEQRVSDLSTGIMTVDFEWSWEQDLGFSGGGSGSSSGSIDPGSTSSGPTAAQLQQKTLLERVRLLEVFNAQNFFNFTKEENSSGGLSRLGIKSGASLTNISGSAISNNGGTQSGGASIASHWTLTEKNLVLNAGQASLINQAYESLRESIYNGLLLQTRLRPYVEAIGITLGEEGISLDFSKVAALFQTTFDNNHVNGATDLLEFVTQPMAGKAIAELTSLTERLVAGLSADEVAKINSLGIGLQVGTTDNQGLSGKDKQDYLFGLAGNDALTGAAGNDYVDGGSGNDSLYGGAGNDTLIGGSGNDYLNGDAGNDVYYFERGWGEDTIYNYDATVGRIDAIEFGTGISQGDIQFGRSNDYLVLSLKGSTDKIWVQNFFQQDGTGSYRVDEVRFADGSVLTTAAIKLLLLQGGEGNDSITGYASDDTLQGGLGNDTLYSRAGNDLLQGGEGNDTLSGEAGNDTLIGGSGNDYLNGDAGNDVYYFERGWGEDTIYNYDTAAGRVDAIEFGTGISQGDIQFGRSNDFLVLSLKGSTDKIWVQNFFQQDGTGSYRVDEVRFADGSVLTTAAIKLLLLQGGEGNDSITGYASDDTLQGGLGNDTLYSRAGNDLLQGGEGNDTLSGEAGNDTLIGGSGNDYLNGDAGNDVYYFERGWGEDTIYNYDATVGRIDAIEFGTGISQGDIQFGRSNDYLVLSLKGSTDKIWVQNFFQQDGTGSYRVDEVRFADGSVLTTAAIKLLLLQGGEGNDSITGYASDDTLQGGLGNDTLYSRAGNDLLQGGEGNDTLSGEAGNDTLIGGSGNDYLSGDAGNDVYYFERGWGEDTIYNYDTAAGRVDAIEFGTGISQGDIQFGRSNDFLVLSLKGSTDKIWVQNFFQQDGTGSYRVDEVRFADGSVLTTAAIKLLLLQGGEGNDSITGYASDDTLQGGLGNDTLYSRAGNDLLQGGEGNDTLSGEAGNDTLIGGSGNDYLSGDAGNDVYYFERGWGEDTIYNYDTAAGRVDAIEFGAGINQGDIQFGRSNDFLVLSLKGSTDKIWVQNFFMQDGTGSYRVDEVRFTDGSVLTTAAIKQLLILKGSDGSDRITGYASDDTLQGGLGNDTLYAGAGNDLLLGGEGNDTLSGEAGNDTLVGGSGNDYLSGDAGNDVYYFERGWGEDTIYNYDTAAGRVDAIEFGAGISQGDIQFGRSNDFLVLSLKGSTDKIWVQSFFQQDGTGSYRVDEVRFADGSVLTTAAIKLLLLQGGEGNDGITGYASDDTLQGGLGNDTLYSRAGNDLLQGGEGNDTLYGEAGNDTLVGGSGNDYLSGDAGNDVYYFERGWGEDTIYNYDAAVGRIDAIEFGAGINQSDIQFGRYNDYLVLSLKGSTDKIWVQSFFQQDGTGSYRVDEVRFADGSVLTTAAIKLLLLQGGEGNDGITGYASDDTLQGGLGNDTLYSRAGNDLLQGGEGNDTLYGEAGNDTLVGGSGNDYLSGDAGNDVYYFERGWGEDTIYNYDAAVGRIDAIEFGAGINQSDIQFGRYNDYLVLSLKGSTDKIWVQSFFQQDGTGSYRVDEVRFADGSVLTTAAIKLLLLQGGEGNDGITGYASDDTLQGGLGNDTLYSRAGNDLLQGGEGNDTLYGEAGNDTLVGGSGNDYLSGDAGNDVYYFERGWGEDTIYNYDAAVGRIDAIEFGAGINQSDIQFGRYNDYLVLSLKGSTDKIWVQSFFQQDGTGSYRVDEVRFADGSVLTTAAIKLLLLQGGEGNDGITGYASDDTLQGGLGNDTLYSRAGNDLLQGGEGNDTLYGEAGNDTLVGGSGNDYLSGDAGNDVYYFERGWGEDTIYNYDAAVGRIDAIEFGAGINQSDIQFGRYNDYLVLSLKGSTDKIWVQSFFQQDGTGSYRVDEVRFADGSVLTTAAIKLLLLQGGEGNDGITGYASDDTLQGGLGNDTLYSRAGNDLLQGGEGNDTLYGEAGNDTLVGGSGNDYLSGDVGNDVYYFGRGSGQDVIYNYHNDANSFDQIIFTDGITADQLWLRQNGSNLDISLIGTSDKVTVSNWYTGTNYHVGGITTSDGKTLLESQVQSLVNAMATFGVPAGGESTLTQDQRQQLEVVIAANWK
ncbi:calcium-binding protein [Pseudomonas sp. YH-1]|uniref:calcium-binding protein n=1 Tax=Pseudomonas sp. YH-1 TaxID=3384787 RepID=UPI003F822705